MMENNENTEKLSKQELGELANELLKETESISISNNTNETVSSGSTASYNKSIADLQERDYQPTISKKEITALKRARYNEIQDKFRYSFVIQNKKTGLVVEIKAASTVHACNIIGWRPKNARVLEIIDSQKKEENTAKEISEGKINTTEEVEVEVEETNTTKVETNA